MTRAERIRLPFWAVLRVAQRDGFTCHVCEQGYDPADPWEIDHYDPLARGGQNRMSNLRLIHRTCNRAKGSA